MSFAKSNVQDHAHTFTTLYAHHRLSHKWLPKSLGREQRWSREPERGSNEETEVGFYKQTFPLIAPSCCSHHGSRGSLWPCLPWSPWVMGSHAWAERGAGLTQTWGKYLLLINIKITYCSSEIVRGWIGSPLPIHVGILTPCCLRMWPYWEVGALQV